MRKSFKVPVIMALGLFAVLAAAAAFSSAEISYRSAVKDGARVAEVLIAERPVITLRTRAASYSPLERAEIVASRLRTALATQVSPGEVTVSSIPYGAALNIKGQLIVAIYASEAEANRTNPTALARLWRGNLLSALGSDAEPVASQPQRPEPAANEPSVLPVATSGDPEGYADWTGTAQKWVPILSIEQSGVQVGAAQIAGPPSQVNQVKGVAELRLAFKNIGRIYAYIPVRTLSVTKLDRVQGVSVWATGQLEIINF